MMREISKCIAWALGMGAVEALKEDSTPNRHVSAISAGAIDRDRAPMPGRLSHTSVQSQAFRPIRPRLDRVTQ